MNTIFRQLSFVFAALSFGLAAEELKHGGYVNLENAANGLDGQGIEEAFARSPAVLQQVTTPEFDGSLQESFSSGLFDHVCEDERMFLSHMLWKAKNLSLQVSSSAFDPFLRTGRSELISQSLPRDRFFISIYQRQTAELFTNRMGQKALGKLQFELKELGELLNYKIIEKTKAESFASLRGQSAYAIRNQQQDRLNAFFDGRVVYEGAIKDCDWVLRRLQNIYRILSAHREYMGCEIRKPVVIGQPFLKKNETPALGVAEESETPNPDSDPEIVVKDPNGGERTETVEVGPKEEDEPAHPVEEAFSTLTNPSQMPNAEAIFINAKESFASLLKSEMDFGKADLNKLNESEIKTYLQKSLNAREKFQNDYKSSMDSRIQSLLEENKTRINELKKMIEVSQVRGEKPSKVFI